MISLTRAASAAYGGDMLVILFRSRLTAHAGDDYHRMADAMFARAKTFPGFIDVKSFTADDGERLTVVWWQDEETLKAWAGDNAHRVAQEAGREKWYEYYKMDVAEIVRVSNFVRPPGSQLAPAS
jgi:heme-degrading monooxygenase HmoA